MYTMAHFLFHQVGGCVIFQIYPIMFCFTWSVGVWFVICIPWNIFRFTRSEGVRCVRHILWNTLFHQIRTCIPLNIFCSTRSAGIICQTFPTMRSAGVWFVRWMPWGIFGFSRSGGVWFVKCVPLISFIARSGYVWFARCIPWIIFCFTRLTSMWFVSHISWNIFCLPGWQMCGLSDIYPMYCFLFHQVGGRALASPLPGWSCFSSCPPWFSASSSCLQRMEKCHLYKAFWEWHLARSHSECERCPEINRQGHPSDPDLLWGFLLTETLQWKKVLFW